MPLQPSGPPAGLPPPLPESGLRTPLGARTPLRGAGPCRFVSRTPGAATPGSRRGGSTPRRQGHVTPPLTANPSLPLFEEDDVIVDGRWLSRGLERRLEPEFYVPEAPVPTGPKALQWLPSRISPDPDFKQLAQEEFLQKLNVVCDSFQPLEPSPVALIQQVRPEQQALESPRAYQLAAAEGALSRLVEEAMWSGPIRHMAICVMAQRVIMLAESARDSPETSPGGLELLVALLSSVKQMCAANTGDIMVDKREKFSGRVVLLLGSASCTPEGLLKSCKDAYREVDHSCILIAVSMTAEPAGSAQVSKAIAAAINVWGEEEARFGAPGTAGGAGRPELLVHLFGMAGFAAWAKMLRLWHEQSFFPDEKRLLGRMLPMEKILKGVVLDSAPGHMTSGAV